MSIVYILSALSIVYGLSWLIFVITEPPARLTHYYRSPNAFYFLPEFAGRLVMALIFCVAIPFSATFIVAMFTATKN